MSEAKNVSSPLYYETLSTLARRIENREVSSVEATQSVLDRIERLDGHLKSYATVLGEDALEEARRADEEIARGNYRGPLHGIPIAVKDLCFTKGIRTMGGLKVLADHIPDYDATVVERFRSAGAVLLGKLNLTEGAMAGYNPDFDAPVNPWDKDRWTGVSSSGSGVATAAGLCFASLGSDTGGSIRFPSACCGIVGLKPTWGRVSRYGVLDLAQSLDHVGPMTRSVKDAAIVFEAIAGHDSNDPTSLYDTVPKMLEPIEEGVQGLRVGLDKGYVTDGVDPQVSAAVLDAVTVLESLGAIVVEFEFPSVADIGGVWNTLCASEALAAHEETYPSRADDYGAWFRDFLELGASVTGSDYAKAHHIRSRFNGALAGVFRDVDVIACPAMPTLPMPITKEILYGGMRSGRSDFMRFTGPFDFSGSPSINLPCGLSEEGLPLSLQLVGKHLSEDLLCRAGHAYETATEWHHLHPEIEQR